MARSEFSNDRKHADRVASALYKLALREWIPEGELQSIAWWAEDALDLSDQGYVTETRDQVIDRMLIVLDEAASSTRA